MVGFSTGAQRNPVATSLSRRLLHVHVLGVRREESGSGEDKGVHMQSNGDSSRSPRKCTSLRDSDASSFSNANTELRLDSLQQRIMSCGRFGSEFAMAKVRWSAALPRHHSRYLLSTTDDARKSSQVTRAPYSLNSKADDNPKLDRDEGLPLFLYTFPMRPSFPKSSKAGDTDSISLVPVRDGPAILYKAPNPTFQFQVSQTQCLMSKNVLKDR